MPGMSVAVAKLFEGKGWKATDFVCTNGPQDRPYEEQHRDFCIAVVTEGTFRYRSRHGAVMHSPGSLLLGNPGTCYECGHEHGVGDRCLSFHYAPEFLEGIVADIPSARRVGFGRSQLPPSLVLAPLVARAEAARDANDAAAAEEVALSLAGAVATALTDAHQPRSLSSTDERRISQAVRRIEASADEPISLGELAGEARLSPYHFLRSFRRIAGMTPYQFVLRTRLHRAAVRLRTTGDAVSTIAFDAGFGDLSTFNRRFRMVMGATPLAYRKGFARRH
jgi:AraC family transcriptional regulator